jgi:hypothetical protein
VSAGLLVGYRTTTALVVTGMEYLIAFDIDAWIEQGIRQLEDFLLVHAAFQAQYPDDA